METQAPALVENHPFEPFVPPGARYLLIGTFPGRALTQPDAALGTDDWYYGTSSHSLWQLLETVYGRPLPTRQAKQDLLTDLKMGITDVVASAHRRKPSNDDKELTDVVFQIEKLAELLKNNAFEAFYFTSKQAQKWFASLAKKLMEDHGVPTARLAATPHVLPSPSPQYVRYGWDTEAGRLTSYQAMLPKMV